MWLTVCLPLGRRMEILVYIFIYYLGRVAIALKILIFRVARNWFAMVFFFFLLCSICRSWFDVVEYEVSCKRQLFLFKMKLNANQPAAQKYGFTCPQKNVLFTRLSAAPLSLSICQLSSESLSNRGEAKTWIGNNYVCLVEASRRKPPAADW